MSHETRRDEQRHFKAPPWGSSWPSSLYNPALIQITSNFSLIKMRMGSRCIGQSSPLAHFERFLCFDCLNLPRKTVSRYIRPRHSKMKNTHDVLFSFTQLRPKRLSNVFLFLFFSGASSMLVPSRFHFEGLFWKLNKLTILYLSEIILLPPLSCPQISFGPHFKVTALVRRI